MKRAYRDGWVRKLRDPDAGVRAGAAWALGRMRAGATRPEVLSALVRAARKDRAPWVRSLAAWALGEMGAAAARPEVVEALASALRPVGPSLPRGP